MKVSLILDKKKEKWVEWPVFRRKNSNSKRDRKMDYEDRIMISMTKAKKARDFHKKKFSKTLMDSLETVEPDSIKKKSEQKTRSLDMIIQIIGEFEVISWDTESQPASSEEIEEDSKNEAQVRGFSNSITDIFDLHEEEADNNCMFRALSRTTFGSSDYHKEVRAQVVDYMTANIERFSAGQNDFEGYLILLRDYHAWVANKNFRHSRSYMMWTSKCTIEWHALILCIIFHQGPTLLRQSGYFIQVITMFL